MTACVFGGLSDASGAELSAGGVMTEHHPVPNWFHKLAMVLALCGVAWAISNDTTLIGEIQKWIG